MRIEQLSYYVAPIFMLISIFWLWSHCDYSSVGYDPLILALTGIPGTAALLYYSSIVRNQQKREYDVFISTPISSLDEREYGILHDEVSQINNMLTKHANAKFNYSTSLKYNSISDMDDEITSAKQDLEALKKSKTFIMIYPQKVVSGSLVEAGYAIALGIPCVFFVRNRQDLPYILREMGQINTNVLIYNYLDIGNILQLISNKKSDLFPNV